MFFDKYIRIALMALSLAFFNSLAAFAVDPTLPIPIIIDKLDSSRIGEIREFWISLPDQYNESGDKYPVLYMMDGDFNFNSGGIGGLRHAAQLGEIPEFIIVGIKNTNRSKDIFPEEVTYADGSKDGGRADQYLDFIQDELQPYISKLYRTEDYRVLYGTSNTGFTAVYALFRNPKLANAHIAVSATLSVPLFRKERDNMIREYRGGAKQLVLVMGENDLPTVISHNGALKESIAELASTGLSCRLTVIGNAGHVPANALLEGLRVLFAGWKITQPLNENSFAEIRAQVDKRLEKYGITGRLPEDELNGLGESLLGEKKYVQAIEVLQYRVESYPRSADAQVSLGDAYRQSGNPDKARKCFKQALALVPGQAAATAKLKELGGK